jgi:SPP1 gp7 family putative phage head morphogenesis protein
MADLKPSYFEPIEDDILDFLYDQFYAPILEITDTPRTLVNSTSAVIAAIRSGKIQYDGGTFRGEFNITLSRELSTFATYDRRFRTWKGNPPPDVKAAAVVANGKRTEIVGKLNSALRGIEARIDRQIESLAFGLDMPLFAMEEGIKSELKGVGIYSPLTDTEKKAMRDRYTFNQQKNVKGWAPEQIVRLRDMVQQYQTTGDTRSLREMIEREWTVSANKARFLARQETSLFFSNLQLDRAGRAGVRRYRWSTSHDVRVRHDHRELQGKIISLDDPPIVDKKTGRRAHAGEDYGCRCAKIWILD